MAVTRKTRVRFRERAELLDFLLEVSAATGETLDLERLMENVSDIVRQVIPHDLFAILLYSERRKGLRIRYSLGHRNEVAHNLLIPLGEGLTGTAAATRQPVMAGNVDDDKRYLNALDAVRSELAVPMLARHKLVGVIDLESTTPDAFSAQDRALLQLIASRVGAAIDNARLYRKVERQSKTQRVLGHMAHEFSSILKLDDLLVKIAKSVRTLINFDAFIVLQVDEERKELRSLFSQRYDQRVQMESLPLGKGITGAAATSRQPVLSRDTATDPRYIDSHLGIRSEVAVPLIVKDRVIGVMDLESERVGYFNEDHVRTLSLIAPSVANAIENARLYQELEQREKAIQDDLEAAQEVQSIMMPQAAPDLPGLNVGVRMKPARLVSGDVFDFFEYSDDHTMLAFGDSSGKGAAAALYGALFSGMLRGAAPRRRSPAQLLKSLNDTLMERQVPARYVTLLVMLWRAVEKKFIMANAGSTTPLVCRGGQILQPHAAGVPVGLLENVEYDETEFQAKSGDVFVLFSDGVQDQGNPEGEEYGRRRLRRFLEGHCSDSAQEIADGLLADLESYRESTPVHDDQTVIVLKVI
ncbi:GAF domain-containing protein [uncultured Paludibaculum sp.]|uniref:GAF domain-containing protein n=1 Tax=uncultured Paludibaculum sp. TaxID=1765020 RepID=UPI002AABE724|nr:SpoIIE family protein phosphatase [uncultured Paludibaculum sp.]